MSPGHFYLGREYFKFFTRRRHSLAKTQAHQKIVMPSSWITGGQIAASRCERQVCAFGERIMQPAARPGAANCLPRNFAGARPAERAGERVEFSYRARARF